MSNKRDQIKLDHTKMRIAERVSMDNGQRVAFALGYLRGISPLLWSIEGAESALQFDSDDAAYYDQQVTVISRALLGRESTIDDE